MVNTMLPADPQSPLAANEAVFALPGDPATLLWVRTCEATDCDCRTAVAVATDAGRDLLLDQAAIVRAAWEADEMDDAMASRLDRCHHFCIHIDSGIAFWSWDANDLNDDPRIGPIARRIDGELLDDIGRLWYRGKGWPSPEQQALDATTITVAIPGWKPGNLAGWNDLGLGVRQDLYESGDTVYQAHEMYCVNPACACSELTVVFEAVPPRAAAIPGHVDVTLPGGAAVAVPAHGGGQRLAELWAAFQHRYPGHVARFAQRYAFIRKIRHRVGRPPTTPRALAPPLQVKVGRNDPCPCGSGLKYKKCCGAPRVAAR